MGREPQPRPFGDRNLLPAPSRASATDSTAVRRRLAGVRASLARETIAIAQADPPTPAAAPIRNHSVRLNMETA